jgi:hypothetical protein
MINLQLPVDLSGALNSPYIPHLPSSSSRNQTVWYAVDLWQVKDKIIKTQVSLDLHHSAEVNPDQNKTGYLAHSRWSSARHARLTPKMPLG